MKGNRSYTLHEVSFYQGIILANYVTTGTELAEITQIEISLTGVSKWMEEIRSFELNEKEIKRYTEVAKFTAPFEFRSNKYAMENSRTVDIDSTSSVSHTINITDSILIYKKNNSFKFSEIQQISLEVRNLFSLLLGKELSIENIWLIPKQKYKYQAFYFTSFNAKKDPLRSHVDAICSFSTINEWGLWETIIKNFFKVKEFRNIWSRLASAYGNNGVYWDYKILSCVVILEMYCKEKSSGKGNKLKSPEFNHIRDKLNNVLDEVAENTSFSENDLKVIDGFKIAVSGIKNTTHPTLQEKFDYLLSMTNFDMRAAISFSDEDFQIMKKIRNSVAHGLDYKPVKVGDISIEMQIKDRLLMLLTYFSYRDLGFNDIQIVKCFRHNFNSFLQNGGGDKKIMDKLSGDVPFIKLSNSKIDKGHPTTYCIAVEKSGEQYQINKRLTNALLENRTWGEYRDIRLFMESMLDANDGRQVEYLNEAYLKSDGIEKLYHGVIMISAQ